MTKDALEEAAEYLRHFRGHFDQDADEAAKKIAAILAGPETDAMDRICSEMHWHEANGPVIDDERYMPTVTAWGMLNALVAPATATKEETHEEV